MRSLCPNPQTYPSLMSCTVALLMFLMVSESGVQTAAVAATAGGEEVRGWESPVTSASLLPQPPQTLIKPS